VEPGGSSPLPKRTCGQRFLQLGRPPRQTFPRRAQGHLRPRHVARGKRISEQHILTIAQIDRCGSQAIVPADHFGKIAQGQTVVVMPEAPAQGEFHALVKIVDRIIDPASGTFRVRAELPNPDGKLPSGLRCQMSLPVDAGGAPAPKH
jgi:multidrug efflux pump subunit AcrA (membrane-fusion protein)